MGILFDMTVFDKTSRTYLDLDENQYIIYRFCIQTGNQMMYFYKYKNIKL